MVLAQICLPIANLLREWLGVSSNGCFSSLLPIVPEARSQSALLVRGAPSMCCLAAWHINLSSIRIWLFGLLILSGWKTLNLYIPPHCFFVAALGVPLLILQRYIKCSLDPWLDFLPGVLERIQN